MISKNIHPFLTGTLMLTSCGLFCRALGFVYRVFLSHTWGEEAMGILQLAAPVMMIGHALASSGTQTAISRLTARREKDNASYKVVAAGSLFSVSVSLLYSLIIFCNSEFICSHFLKELRCLPLLKILSLSLPFSALSDCIKGFYYGKKEARIPAFTQVIEQIVRVSFIFLFASHYIRLNQSPPLFLTSFGLLLGEITTCIICTYCYLTFDNKKHSFFLIPQSKYLFSILNISLPITINRVLVQILQGMENICLLTSLRNFGYSADTALSLSGVFSGMAMTLIFLPATFTNSASMLLMPIISEADSLGDRSRVQSAFFKTSSLNVLFGSFFGCIFFLFSDFFGNFLFGSTLASSIIKKLSLLCPCLYLKSILFSTLIGVNKTACTLFINIFSLIIRIIFTAFLVPSYGMNGYLFSFYTCEIFSMMVSFYFLRKYI